MRARVDPARFGALLAVLWAAHDVGDHIVQTDHQAASKATSWRAMAGHVGGYHALQVAALLVLRLLAGVRPSWRRTVTAVLLSAGTHAVLDRRWPVIRVLERTGSPGFAASTVIPSVTVEATHPDYRASAPERRNLIGVTDCPRLPLHGPYLADQALHHGVLAVCAAILAR